MGTILVLDDDAGIVKLCVTALSHQGHTVAAATTEKEFNEAIQKEKFDLLVADLRLPDTNGLMCASKAIELQSKIGIIIITGTPNLEIWEKEVISKIAFRLIFKPFDIKDLEEAVESYLKTH